MSEFERVTVRILFCFVFVFLLSPTGERQAGKPKLQFFYLLTDPNAVPAPVPAPQGSGGDSGAGARPSTTGGAPETVTITAEVHSPMRSPLGSTPTRLSDSEAAKSQDEEPRVEEAVQEEGQEVQEEGQEVGEVIGEAVEVEEAIGGEEEVGEDGEDGEDGEESKESSSSSSSEEDDDEDTDGEVEELIAEVVARDRRRKRVI